MRTKISIVGLLWCLVSVSAPIRSNLGGENTEWLENWNPTAADYVMDGLVCMWDAIENGGPGIHDPTLNKATWVEWCGTGWQFDYDQGGFFGDDWFGQTGQTAKSCESPTASNLRSEVLYDTYTWEVALGEIFADDLTGNVNEYLMGTYKRDDSTFGSWRDIFYYSPSTGKMGNSDTFPFVTVSPYSRFNLVSIHNYDTLTSTAICYVDGRLASARTRTLPAAYLPRYYYGQYWYHKCHCIRIYDRVLSDSELAWNRLVDAVRFGKK